MMDCRDYIDWIALTLDGSLPPDRAQELRNHMASCDRCRAEHRLQEKILGSLAEEVPSGLAPDFTERVSHEVLRISRTEKRVQWAILIPVPSIAFAIIMLFVFRSQIGGAVLPAMESLAALISPPVLGIGGRFANLVSTLPAVAAEDAGGLGLASRVFGNTLVAAGIACVVALWGILRLQRLLSS